MYNRVPIVKFKLDSPDFNYNVRSPKSFQLGSANTKSSKNLFE